MRKYYSRKFLNKNSGLAAIECYTETYKGSAGMDIVVSISDCSKKVQLDFSVFSKKELVEKFNKLDLLITELQKLQNFVVENYEAVEEALVKQEKERKQRKNKTKSVDEVLSEL